MKFRVTINITVLIDGRLTMGNRRAGQVADCFRDDLKDERSTRPRELPKKHIKADLLRRIAPQKTLRSVSMPRAALFRLE